MRTRSLRGAIDESDNATCLLRKNKLAVSIIDGVNLLSGKVFSLSIRNSTASRVTDKLFKIK